MAAWERLHGLPYARLGELSHGQGQVLDVLAARPGYYFTLVAIAGRTGLAQASIPVLAARLRDWLPAGLEVQSRKGRGYRLLVTAE
jgi:DNA-binding MarR family transcriptional regulator